ncbi:MAG: hypothetical protein J6I73_07765 [Treponema sp.]|nr:hypothetical protein [Treponema sp.]
MEESKAREILGKNFIGSEELPRINNLFSVIVPKEIPDIPFSETEIQSKKNSHILILCVSQFSDGSSITIANIREKIALCNGNPCFYNQDWYLNEQFINKPLELKWLFVSKDVLDESRAMPADSVIAKYELHSAVELTYTFFVNFFVNNGEKLWNNDYVWCSDVDDKGDQIYVGRYTDASGLNADGFEIHRHLRIKKNYGVV